MFGSYCLAAEIDSNADPTGHDDWRATINRQGAWQPHALAPTIVAKLADYIQRLGSVFGSADLILTPSGDYVFLEMNELKIAGAESHRETGYLGLLNDSITCQVRPARMQPGFTSVNQLIFGIERLLIIWIGAALVIDNAMSVGMLIAFLAYKDQFVQRISTLIDKAVDIRMLRL
jgi:hypothetical protein